MCSLSDRIVHTNFVVMKIFSVHVITSFGRILVLTLDYLYSNNSSSYNTLLGFKYNVIPIVQISYNAGNIRIFE